MLQALHPVAGSGRLIFLRLGLLIVASLPAGAVATVGVWQGAARSPYYTDVEGPLGLSELLRMVGEIPEAFVPALLVGGLVVLLGDQVLTAGAIALLSRDTGDRSPRVLHEVRRGVRHLGPL
ncbi:MAG: hypothetical protein V3T14_06625, partial [Myxococcota bacterium]